MPAVAKSDLFASLPPEWPDSLLPEIQARVRCSGHKVVVLDDDPTGAQTVHDVPVLTHWPVQALAAELANDLSCFYLLTNSRSLPLPAAQTLNAEIARNLAKASEQSGRDYVIVSRSDSTLRGHYPGETDALAEALGGGFDVTLIIPFFLEGGRYTIGNMHYVAEGERLIPAGETPFARDSAFGFQNSDLRQWVEEKTDGQVRASQVATISLEDLRLHGPAWVAEKLLTLDSGSVCVVNAASYRDVEVFVAGLLAAEAQGKRFLYRTAASFVRVRAGIAPRPLLTPAELDFDQGGGGLFIVGSYVPKTTIQVEALLEQTDISRIEIDVQALLADDRQGQEIGRVAKAVEVALRAGEDVVMFTNRRLVTVADCERSLAIGQRVSNGLIAIVCAISTRPRFVLAKGGITSSDVATQALDIKQAMVLGQILPGVPVWQCGPESRFPGMTYIVFPGNVGGAKALVEVEQTASTKRRN
ncbi:MAG: hypothetical protein GY762_16345 [Proteobacteria bacterium]|nr:hypothetical protein [Pseudomonadota bacterium]